MNRPVCIGALLTIMILLSAFAPLVITEPRGDTSTVPTQITSSRSTPAGSFFAVKFDSVSNYYFPNNGPIEWGPDGNVTHCWYTPPPDPRFDIAMALMSAIIGLPWYNRWVGAKAWMIATKWERQYQVAKIGNYCCYESDEVRAKPTSIFSFPFAADDSRYRNSEVSTVAYEIIRETGRSVSTFLNVTAYANRAVVRATYELNCSADIHTEILMPEGYFYYIPSVRIIEEDTNSEGHYLIDNSSIQYVDSFGNFCFPFLNLVGYDYQRHAYVTFEFEVYSYANTPPTARISSPSSGTVLYSESCGTDVTVWIDCSDADAWLGDWIKEAYVIVDGVRHQATKSESDGRWYATIHLDLYDYLMGERTHRLQAEAKDYYTTFRNSSETLVTVKPYGKISMSPESKGYPLSGTATVDLYLESSYPASQHFDFWVVTELPNPVHAYATYLGEDSVGVYNPEVYYRDNPTVEYAGITSPGAFGRFSLITGGKIHVRFSIEYSGATDGRYYPIYFFAKTGIAGKSCFDTYGYEADVVADATPPTFTQTPLDITVSHDCPFSMTWKATDSHPGTYEIRRGTSLVASDTWASNAPITYNCLGEDIAGTFYYTCKVSDTVGNSNSHTVKVTVTHPDTTPPVVSIVSPVNGETIMTPAYATYIYICASASDPQSRIINVEVKVNSKPWVAATYYSGYWYYQPYEASGKPAIAYTIQVRATNEAGLTTTTGSITVYILKTNGPGPI